MSSNTQKEINILRDSIFVHSLMDGIFRFKDIFHIEGNHFYNVNLEIIHSAYNIESHTPALDYLIEAYKNNRIYIIDEKDIIPIGTILTLNRNEEKHRHKLTVINYNYDNKTMENPFTYELETDKSNCNCQTHTTIKVPFSEMAGEYVIED